MLQPPETADNRQSLEMRRKSRQNEESRPTTLDGTAVKEKILLHPSDKSLPLDLITEEVTGHRVKEPHSVVQRQLVAATVSPPSSAVDDTWDFLSDSPQKVTIETANQQVWCYHNNLVM